MLESVSTRNSSERLPLAKHRTEGSDLLDDIASDLKRFLNKMRDALALVTCFAGSFEELVVRARVVDRDIRGAIGRMLSSANKS